jgi:1-acyl-sn-glycerol-3-phosphate acyltransferase
MTYVSKLMDGIFDPSINHIIVSRDGGSFEHIRDQVSRHVLDRGRSVYFYPSNGFGPYDVQPFRTGMFRIAADLNIPLVPIVFSHLGGPVFSQDRTIHICIGSEMQSKSFEQLVSHGESFFQSRFHLLRSHLTAQLDGT